MTLIPGRAKSVGQITVRYLDQVGTPQEYFVMTYTNGHMELIEVSERQNILRSNNPNTVLTRLEGDKVDIKIGECTKECCQ